MTAKNPNYISREGLCEICGKSTNLLVWNIKFSEWDFVCEECQEDIGILNSYKGELVITSEEEL